MKFYSIHGPVEPTMEMYNRGVRIINLKELSINRNTAGTIANIKQLNTDNHLFFPGDYLVITEEPDICQAGISYQEYRRFYNSNPAALL